MADPTEKHREEARELVESVFRPRGTSPIYATAGRLFDELEIKFASVLSSRDTEIREVLEGLITHVLDGVQHWCPISEDYGGDCSEACLATRVLWEKVQPAKESSDGR